MDGSVSDRRRQDGSVAGVGGHRRQTELRRIVLVESDQHYREVLTFELLCQGFVVHAFADGLSLLGSLATAVDSDLAVLDWDLPKMPGVMLLAELRRQSVNLPAVFLTGKFLPGNEQLRARVSGIPECLRMRRLRSRRGRLHSQVPQQGGPRQAAEERGRTRQAQANAALEEPLACGKLLLKPETSRACWNGVDVDLTLGEYKIVHLLVSNAGSFVTYRSLYDRLHFQGFIAGSGTDGFRANVRSAIKRIRNKFHACDASFDDIENYNGFGYCWRKPD